ncbi:pentapeptide repeat-containing protein [Actinomadura sp. KC06]|uniref:pentapeptide repeat-containing protein n=1 Tax=Actinomadura sp. KC06 TaxID=2530369 RepID=UPI00104C768E|nr:pentapeptide repeat-containing protein [Actinomadura sp. KC06]TDD38670.1 pentapeptide repeat-containing protein [Actinomadura sp. KC06]
MAQTPTSSAAGEQVLPVDPPPPQGDQARALPIWIWPALAITLVAVCGEFLGTRGSLAALGFCLVGGFVLMGRALNPRERGFAVALAVVFAGLATLVIHGSSARDLFDPGTADKKPAGPVDLRGKTLTADVVKRTEFRGALLAGAQLGGLDLRHENFAGASAQGITLSRTRLDGVSFRGADLRGADLRDACLRGGDLTGADLFGARVDRADLSGAEYDEAAEKTWRGKPSEGACR